jgi:hypothetical protein
MHVFTQLGSAPRNAIPVLPQPKVWPPSEPGVTISHIPDSDHAITFNNFLRDQLRPRFADYFPCFHDSSATSVFQGRMPLQYVNEVWNQSRGLVQWRRIPDKPTIGSQHSIFFCQQLFCPFAGWGSGTHVDTLGKVLGWNVNGLKWSAEFPVTAWAYVACEPKMKRGDVSKLFWAGDRTQGKKVVKWYFRYHCKSTAYIYIVSFTHTGHVNVVRRRRRRIGPTNSKNTCKI